VSKKVFKLEGLGVSLLISQG